MKIENTFREEQVLRRLSMLALTGILIQTTCVSAQSTWQEQVTGLEETRVRPRSLLAQASSLALGV